MGRPARSLIGSTPLGRYGAELRSWRTRHGLSADALGRLAHCTGSTVLKVEKGERRPPAGFTDAADTALETGGVLARLLPPDLQDDSDCRPGVSDKSAAAVAGPAPDLATIETDQEGNMWAVVGRRRFLVGAGAAALASALPTGSGTAAAVSDDPFGFARTMQAWGARVSHQRGGYDADWAVRLPGGRSLLGAGADVQLYPARLSGPNVRARLVNPQRTQTFRRRPGRGLLVGARRTDEGHEFYAADARHVGAASSGRAVDLEIPQAYRLDDVTVGILWAAANLDDALQADDRALDLARKDAEAYERESRSSVSRDEAPELNPVASMWLGSEFCAGQILRALPEFSVMPSFWTRESRGEEASTWLLFDHKHRYLQATSRRLPGAPRAFCIPRAVVDSSPRSERVLLFLAIALMESLGIRVDITSDEAYVSVEGFVVAPRRQAVLANWVGGSDRIWHVDTHAPSASVRDYTDVAGAVAAHSAITAISPQRRVRAAASYLGLDWGWIVHRCAELAATGTAGLVGPRSRLMSTDGLDAALRFVGSIPATV